MPGELIPTREAARRLRKSISTVAHWVTEGKLQPALKGTGLRGSMWFDADVIDAIRAEEDAKYEPLGQEA